MEIKATQYTREDGVSIHQLPNGKWVIRRIGPGPAWFYCVPGQHHEGHPRPNGDGTNPGGWVITSTSGFEAEWYSYSFEVAMETLKVVSKN
jgi:hypothetical protein